MPSVFSAAAAYPEAGSASLLDAFKFGGGGGGAVRILLRASLASLLDASPCSLWLPHSVRITISVAR